MPLFGPPDVGKLESTHNIGGLVKALRYQADSQLRGHVKIRQDAAQALGRIAGPAGVPALAAALKSKDASAVRAAAAAALGRIADPRGGGALVEALADSFSEVVGAASAALRAIGGPRVVDLLVAALPSGGSAAREAAMDLLGDLRDARATRPLFTPLGDQDRRVRKAAAVALGKIGNPQAVDRLIAALHDKDTWVRAAAAIALGQIGDPRAIAPLVAALRDREIFARNDAARALMQLRVARGPINGVAAEELESLLEDLAEQCNMGARAEALVDSAERAGYATEPLLDDSRASSARIGEIRLILLEKGGDPLVREAVALASTKLRVPAFEYLKRLWIEAQA